MMEAVRVCAAIADRVRETHRGAVA